MLHFILLAGVALAANVIADCSYESLQETATDYVAPRATAETSNLTHAIYTENFERRSRKRSAIFAR
ncbi:hypothetical protein NLJ89_g1134 [Agrocybe chaxingu]|uniref:Uncharacterized protein n=1 Tax=Agrocybe chaxingu TaxID=84603 RepID=A0A9W8TEY0_9AGAR|nr:hypothetical protein NLJ89_g1134 [Agrocybe chaxingu]